MTEREEYRDTRCAEKLVFPGWMRVPREGPVRKSHLPTVERVWLWQISVMRCRGWANTQVPITEVLVNLTGKLPTENLLAALPWKWGNQILKSKRSLFLLQCPPVPFYWQGLTLWHQQRKCLYRVQLQYHKAVQRGVNVGLRGNTVTNSTPWLWNSYLETPSPPVIVLHLGWISYVLDSYLPLSSFIISFWYKCHFLTKLPRDKLSENMHSENVLTLPDSLASYRILNSFSLRISRHCTIIF